MRTLAFDVYGTLIDTAGVTTCLESFVGDQATEFSNLWRQKQLEYTWRYGLMSAYEDFRACTKQALAFCCDQLDASISDENRQALMQVYLELPVFDDVIAGLDDMQAVGLKLYAFSNGVPADLSALLEHAGINGYFDGIVSVDDIKTFKPDPRTYQYFAEKSDTPIQDCWLVSSNGFDVCGARASGMRAIWVQRNKALGFDHWQYQPDHVVDGFAPINSLLAD